MLSDIHMAYPSEKWTNRLILTLGITLVAILSGVKGLAIKFRISAIILS